MAEPGEASHTSRVPNAAVLPEALRAYVVSQEYDRYDAADQAVWRFVMLHLGQHLRHTAHHCYVAGLEGSALSAAAIPRIADMNRALLAQGWGAVCVNGFIPPRVFQHFQALGVLPIAADIRKPNHVAYTPAPDIIHEAAGHAPILVNRAYGQYLRHSGEAALRAFSCPEDHAVTEAITELSRVKELLPDGSPEIAAAERRLQQATENLTAVSEVAQMARLYWWTAEYGLIGTPSDYRLYGAGLLSSLGEAVYCRDGSVEKIPLDESCVQVSYDITRPQPQLFVTPSFEALFDVLDRVTATLAASRGVEASLAAARHSRLPCRVALSDGTSLSGTLSSYRVEHELTRLEFGAEAHVLRHENARVVSVEPADAMAVPAPSERTGPATRQLSANERRLRELYEQAEGAWRQRFGASFVRTYERVQQELDRHFPDEWLLRWNLLENLLELGETDRTERLAGQLERLEERFAGKEPIATGLRSLRERVRAASSAREAVS
jgi:phenylalanine-4-hydroxylase